MSPTIGRIVHYQSADENAAGQPLPSAALVVDVGEGELVDLAVFVSTGLFFEPVVPHAPNDEPTPGHWNWPPRTT